MNTINEVIYIFTSKVHFNHSSKLNFLFDIVDCSNLLQYENTLGRSK